MLLNVTDIITEVHGAIANRQTECSTVSLTCCFTFTKRLSGEGKERSDSDRLGLGEGCNHATDQRCVSFFEVTGIPFALTLPLNNSELIQ